jgi:hypothetical protein
MPLRFQVRWRRAVGGHRAQGGQFSARGNESLAVESLTGIFQLLGAYGSSLIGKSWKNAEIVEL